MLIYQAESYAALADECRDFLLSLVEEGAGKPVRKKHRSDPGIYGGEFPAMTLRHSGDVWNPKQPDRPHLPGGMEFEVAFKDLALSRKRPADDWKSGAEEAEGRCEAAFSAFLEGLSKDPRMGERVSGVDVTSVEAGDRDRLGNAFADLNSENQLLWALVASVRVVFVY